jgi:hypothetical protein
MTPVNFPPDYPRIRRVSNFRELVTTRFADGVNALCWERTLPGDFAEVMAQLGDSDSEAVVTLDEARLRSLALGAAGRTAVEQLLADLQLLRDRDLDPVLNCINGYPRDEEAVVVPTDVFSFHADRAPIEACTYLCTYHGPASEGLRNEDAQRRVDVPETRAALLKTFGGKDDDGFRAFLAENCYDLHYAAAPGAQPYSFGLGHLWRIAIEYPGCPVPPCVHRAPATLPGERRLLLIS